MHSHINICTHCHSTRHLYQSAIHTPNHTHSYMHSHLNSCIHGQNPSMSLTHSYKHCHAPRTSHTHTCSQCHHPSTSHMHTSMHCHARSHMHNCMHGHHPRLLDHTMWSIILVLATYTATHIASILILALYTTKTQPHTLQSMHKRLHPTS